MAAAATTNWVRSASRILVASSDPKVRQRVLGAPELGGVERMEACGGAHALAKLREKICDGVLLDRNLADLDSAEVAEMIRREHPGMGVCWIESSEGEESSEAEAGAGESSEKRRQAEVVAPSPQETRNDGEAAKALPGMIGMSGGMEEVYRLARLVAKRDTAVLVSGETGTGKELVAEAIHELSPRAKQPFVVVNCAAIPEPLLEAELFGHARGAFTGAVQSRLGRIHVAQGGTLFLDEIGELPLGMQAKILRFLQSGEVQRLGSAEVHRVDVRVICATNAELSALIEAKQFRMDLYYRLAVFPISLPPLRERCGDIELLAEHFLMLLCEESHAGGKQLGEKAREVLRRRQWPGNVRELQHAMERAFILSGEEAELRPEHFPCHGLDANGRGR